MERQNPEEYARKAVNTTSPKKVAAALRFVQEAALEAMPAEFHETLYHHVQAAIDEAFCNCFPTMGHWGAPKFPKLPVETPLADGQADKAWRAQTLTIHDRDEQGNIVPPPPVDPAEVAARQAKQAALEAQRAELKRRLAENRKTELSPKTREATGVACDATPADPLYVGFEAEEAVFMQQEREQDQRQRTQEFIRLFDESQQRESVLFPAAEAV